MTARLARVLVAADQSAEALEDPGERRPPRAPATLDVGQGAGDRDFHASAHDVERGRAVLALPADDVARAEPPANHRAPVEREERAGRAREHRQVEEVIGRDLLALLQIDVDRALVGERAGGTAHHALAAAHAARRAHRQVGVENDARLRALAAAADHEVLLDVAAGADAAVAEDAGGVVHLDDRRRVVAAARVGAGGEPGLVEGSEEATYELP